MQSVYASSHRRFYVPPNADATRLKVAGRPSYFTRFGSGPQGTRKLFSDFTRGYRGNRTHLTDLAKVCRPLGTWAPKCLCVRLRARSWLRAHRTFFKIAGADLHRCPFVLRPLYHSFVPCASSFRKLCVLSVCLITSLSKRTDHGVQV